MVALHWADIWQHWFTDNQCGNWSQQRDWVWCRSCIQAGIGMILRKGCERVAAGSRGFVRRMEKCVPHKNGMEKNKSGALIVQPTAQCPSFPGEKWLVIVFEVWVIGNWTRFLSDSGTKNRVKLLTTWLSKPICKFASNVAFITKTNILFTRHRKFHFRSTQTWLMVPKIPYRHGILHWEPEEVCVPTGWQQHLQQ